GDAILALSRELQATSSMISPLDTHFHAAFGHLDGYSSGYYTYMWSLVIAKDLFSAFDRDNLFDAEIAARYRDRILAQGGRKDAADLVEDFLGRPFGFDSFANWLEGLAEHGRRSRRPGSDPERREATSGASRNQLEDRLVDGPPESVDDREVARDVSVRPVAAPPEAGVHGLRGTTDHRIGLDTGVGDDVDVL